MDSGWEWEVSADLAMEEDSAVDWAGEEWRWGCTTILIMEVAKWGLEDWAGWHTLDLRGEWL